MSQIDWAVQMLKRYRDEKKGKPVGIRRLHYFIVSLPEHERKIPTKKDYRLYENTRNEYKRLSELIVNARINGLIPFEWIIDEKNEPLINMPQRISLTASINHDYKNPGSIPYLDYADPIPEWGEFIDSVEFRAGVNKPQFTHQTHRIVVVIEKATAKDELERLCRRYGADLIIFSGQLSLTRVNDAVENAQYEEKPIALLYISDLDCGGWVMPPAFFRRIQEIYPHEEHTMVRVALTREQATQYNLPPAFDPDDKKYPETQKKNFIEESGGRECIELDALDENILLRLLGTELEKWAKLDKDEEEYQEKLQKYEEKVEELNNDCDLSEFQEEYEEVREDYNKVVEEIEQFVRGIREKADEMKYKKQLLLEKLELRLSQRKGG